MKSADDVLFDLSPVLLLIHFLLAENKRDSGYLCHILPVGWANMTFPLTLHPYGLVTYVILCEHRVVCPGASPRNVLET